MTTKKVICAAILALCLASMPKLDGEARAGEKRDAIVTLLESSRAMDLMDQLIDAQLPALMNIVRQMGTDVPQPVIDEIEALSIQEFKESKHEFLDAIVVMYDDNFTLEEIVQLSAFYQSPIGQKVVAAMPKITQQSVAIGQIWGTEVGRRVVERAQARLIDSMNEF